MMALLSCTGWIPWPFPPLRCRSCWRISLSRHRHRLANSLGRVTRRRADQFAQRPVFSRPFSLKKSVCFSITNCSAATVPPRPIPMGLMFSLYRICRRCWRRVYISAVLRPYGQARKVARLSCIPYAPARRDGHPIPRYFRGRGQQLSAPASACAELPFLLRGQCAAASGAIART